MKSDRSSNVETPGDPMTDRAADGWRAEPGPELPRPLYVLLWAVPLVFWVIAIAFATEIESLADENGPIEWLGTVAFGTAAVLFWRAAWRDKRRANTVMSTLLGVIFFVACMEELSWGQQIFKWDTPEAFDSNLQQETNLHNFAIGFDQQRLFTLGILGLAVIVPLLYRWQRTRGWLVVFGLPSVAFVVAAWAVVNVFVPNVAERIVEAENHRILRESMESLLGVAALLVGLAAFQQARGKASTPPGESAVGSSSASS